MKEAILKRPWLVIVAVFIVLIGAWTALIVVAVKNEPTPIDPITGEIAR